MKNYKAIEKTLKRHKTTLKKNFNVKKIGVFGSYAKGKESKRSDVDILVEFSEPIGWEFFDLKEFLETVLNKKVDLVTVNAIKPQLKEKILNEIIYA
jgi:hypothetical protein